MEKIIKLKDEYNTLDKLHHILKTASSFECTKEYDSWENRLDDKGQMEQCLVLKKSNMHAAKIHFIDDNSIKLSHIIPSKMMHAYFGKSQKRYQNIIEIITGKIKEIALAPAQKKAFSELTNEVAKAVA